MKCAVVLLNAIYRPMRLLKKRNKVTLISSQSGEATLDISMLAEELKRSYPQTEVKVLASRMKRSAGGVLAFAGHMLAQMYHIATSRAVVVERYCAAVDVLRHREGVAFLQIWHAPEAIKKFGYQTLDTRAGLRAEVARVMRVHRSYDYVLCPAKATAPYFCAAFDVDESKLVYLGLPRIDYISSVTGAGGASVRARIEHTYPTLKDKERKTVLYAPTFRDGRPTDMEGLLREIDFDLFNVALKPHPLDDSVVAFAPARAEGLIIDRTYSAIDWFSVCDAVITDYSGLAVEAAAAGKPTYFYLYDVAAYEAERGLNVNLKEEAIGTYVFEDAASLAACLADGTYDLAALRAFRDKYLECGDTGNTAKLAAFIINML
jgi:CDP-ribitol ribitolphosphotransferase